MNKFNLKPAEEFTQPDKEILFETLYESFKAYVEFCNGEKYHEDNDFAHYLYEDLCQAIAPDFIKWLNKRREEE